jgi:hypothetical protein
MERKRKIPGSYVVLLLVCVIMLGFTFADTYGSVIKDAESVTKNAGGKYSTGKISIDKNLAIDLSAWTVNPDEKSGGFIVNNGAESGSIVTTKTKAELLTADDDFSDAMKLVVSTDIKSPKTGADIQLVICATVLIVSCILVMGFTVFDKEKKKEAENRK